jgi:YHS domain-containing protein
MPEEKSDDQPNDVVKKPTSENDNPFSGLSLDDEFGPVSKPAPIEAVKPETASEGTADIDQPTKPEKTTGETPSTDEPVMPETATVEEPAKLETPDTDRPASETKVPENTAANSQEINPDNIPVPPEALPTTPAKEEVEAKMKLIAERGELRGLKGFCPVALRDERDLRNALPEHHSTYKGRTFYFSTADAKTAFDAHPQKYAPISGGQDVVLLKEKVTKEGSLDHAVWFKDRLYLFLSQKTLEQFVATPKEFAISE